MWCSSAPPLWVSQERCRNWRRINTSSVSFLPLYYTKIQFQASKNGRSKAMAALSALKVGGGSPNVCFATLRPSTKNSGLSASPQKYGSYARCSKSTTEQNDVVFKLSISTSDGFAFGLLCTFNKVEGEKSMSAVAMYSQMYKIPTQFLPHEH